MYGIANKVPLSMPIMKLPTTQCCIWLATTQLLLLLMPAQGFDSFPKLSPNYPSRGCNLDDMVETMTMSDLRNIMAAWASREGLPPVAVLRSLETSTIWPNSHQTWKARKSTKIEDDLEDIGDQRMSELKLKGPGPPIQLPPPSGNFLPPSLLETQRSLSPFHIGKLHPPPDALVYVETSTERLPAIAIAVSPGMGISDVLRQASIKFDIDNPSSAINYYRTSVSRHRKLNCYVVESVGDIGNSREMAWKVTVKDPSKKVLSAGRCLPSDHDIEVQPGTTIALSYVRKGR